MKNIFLIPFLFVTLISCSQNIDLSEEDSDYVEEENTKKLVVITLDGVRWQEIFRGADSTLLADYGSEQGKELFWSEDKEIRKERLFDTDYFANHGSLYGNRDKNSPVYVKNSHRISYPGYHEIFTGNIGGVSSNAATENPHETLFEYINRQPDYNEVTDVQVYAMWKRMRELFRVQSSQLMLFTPMQIEYGQPKETISLMHWMSENFRQNLEGKDIDEFDVGYEDIISTFNDLHGDLLPFGGNILESVKTELLLYATGKEFMKKTNPKAAYFQFSMSDKFGHSGKYDEHLKSIHNVSVFIKDLIQYVENDPFYAGETSIFITTDHGRGIGGNWKKHGSHVSRSDEIWFTLINPEEPAKGEVSDTEQYFQIQFAPTMGELIDIPYEPEHNTAEPIEF